MEKVFLSVFNLGLTASWLIAAVMTVRILMKKAPKNIICLLWIIVGLRLACPFQITSVFSLLPEKKLDVSVSDAGGRTDSQAVPVVNVPEKEAFTVQETVMPAAETRGYDSALIHAAAYIWAAGMLFMLLYLVFNWRRVKISVSTAVPAEYEGIRFYFCDTIAAPFLFGLTVPKIYVPFSVPEQQLFYVLRHEKAHKSRLDHLVKPAGYLLLAVYWFHPLVWAAYLLMCRDMELACDEKVIRELGDGCKKAYSQALLSCAVNGRTSVCPVSFGEIGVKKRVKNILNYKKPKFWVSLAALGMCVAVTACFATETKTETKNKSTGEANQEVLLSNGDQEGNVQEGQAANQQGSVQEGQTANQQGSVQEDSRDGRENGSMESGKNESMESGENESMASSGEEAEADSMAVKKHITKWAEAFCGRDAAAIGRMLDDAGKKELTQAGMLEGEHSFGWSSPWPWDAGVIGDGPNYEIVSAGKNKAVVLFYAWTSDPHVTAWQQVLEYRYQEAEDTFLVTDVTTTILDSIASADEFYAAYPGGVINGTRMDYYQGNGVGRTLNDNMLLSSTNTARLLRVNPAAAAFYLLNIDDDPSKTAAEVSKESGETIVTFTFLNDGRTARVKMIQPYGEHTIWLPQTDDVTRPEFAEFGIVYDAQTDRYYYDGKLIRYFADNHSGSSSQFSGSLLDYADGEVDIVVVRDASGEVTDLEVYDSAHTREDIAQHYERKRQHFGEDHNR